MLNLYTAEQARRIDQQAQQHGLTGLVLMKRAADFAFQVLKKQWPDAKTLGILCGTGNNGGDGYALAKIAHIAGYSIRLFQINEPPQQGDAASARQEAEALGIFSQALDAQALLECDLLVDGLFGIGLNRPLDEAWQAIIELINLAPRPVLALDIPSGLDATGGEVLGAAIEAEHTATFIVAKTGLFLNQGPDHAGEIHLSSLDIAEELLKLETPVATSWQAQDIPQRTRAHHSHKGTFGTALLIGGDHSMMGALALAGQACLRSGAGLVKLISRDAHLIPLCQIQPELMCYPANDFSRLKGEVQVIAAGPGLGQGDWSWRLFEQVCEAECPLVLDADALNCLALQPFHYDRWILTPHPGEAGRLLERPAHVIQRDRIAAVKALHKRYGGVIVLKGAGTLIFDGEHLALCQAGNPGMAVGGMGDVLTGLIAGLVAQGMPLFDAARLGVEFHARTADKVAQQRGEPSLLPSDVIQAL